jgi:hypothetical protein
MQNIIDMSNHILRFSRCYFETGIVTTVVREDALRLCLKHGDEFCIGFVSTYLKVQGEEEMKKFLDNPKPGL